MVKVRVRNLKCVFAVTTEAANKIKAVNGDNQA